MKRRRSETRIAYTRRLAEHARKMAASHPARRTFWTKEAEFQEAQVKDMERGEIFNPLTGMMVKVNPYTGE